MLLKALGYDAQQILDNFYDKLEVKIDWKKDKAMKEINIDLLEDSRPFFRDQLRGDGQEVRGRRDNRPCEASWARNNKDGETGAAPPARFSQWSIP